MKTFRRLLPLIIAIVALSLSGCAATAMQVIPTQPPSPTATSTVTPSPTPDANATATATPTSAPPTGGPSPTALFGPTRTPSGDDPTPTRVLDPNAPRIEYFSTDVVAVAPGSSLNLFWSTRGVNRVVIYQLDRSGDPSRLWNGGPDGTLEVQTSSRDRGQVDFLLSVGEDDNRVEQSLSVALACPLEWFFNPSPETCPNEEAEETFVIQQPFDRGRMVYLAATDRVYALFNDDREPAWVSFTNRYDPSIHEESDPNFPGLQPLARLGLVWRGEDTVRNRLGLPLEEEFAFDGTIQTATARDGSETLYISSTGGTVLELLSNGDSWQIITLSSP